MDKNSSNKLLKEFVRQTMKEYFTKLDGHPVDKVYDLVIGEVEKPLLEETIKSLEGEISGDSILTELYLRVNEMNELHRKLDIQLVGNISKRSGILRIGNIGQSLIGIIPGLRIKKLEIGSKGTTAHDSSGLLTKNYILSLKADVVKTSRSK